MTMYQTHVSKFLLCFCKLNSGHMEDILQLKTSTCHEQNCHLQTVVKSGCFKVNWEEYYQTNILH